MNKAIEDLNNAQWEYTRKERCSRHGRTGNVACQFCSTSMYISGKGFTCEV